MTFCVFLSHLPWPCLPSHRCLGVWTPTAYPINQTSTRIKGFMSGRSHLSILCLLVLLFVLMRMAKSRADYLTSSLSTDSNIAWAFSQAKHPPQQLHRSQMRAIITLVVTRVLVLRIVAMEAYKSRSLWEISNLLPLFDSES